MNDKAQFVKNTYEHQKRVRVLMNEVVAGLVKMSAIHDRSKLMEPELSGYAEGIPKLAGTVYGDDAYIDALREMKPTLEHHYEKNDHHPEHYKNGVADMDLLDLIEMVCDWVAAASQYGSGIEVSLPSSIERFKIDTQLASIIGNTLQNMGWDKQED